MNILITGATGNVGMELIKQLLSLPGHGRIIAAVRNIESARRRSELLEEIECRCFDFEDASTFDTALEDIDLVFLLRPPHLSDINTYFAPLLQKMKEGGGPRVVLLSVQGAERSTIIPHRKIELLLESGGFEYVFLRPSYFMQNLTTTLYPEIRTSATITLPSGNAKFNWIDVADVARVGAEVILNFEKYRNTALTVTGWQNLGFGEVVSRINRIAGSSISYQSVDPIRYFCKKKREDLGTGIIIVMLLLHFLPRLQGEAEVVDTYRDMFGTDPLSLEDFIESNVGKFALPNPIPEGSSPLTR